MLDTRLFRSASFSAGVTSGLLSYLVMFGVLLVVPFFLERALGLDLGRTGLELAVMPVALGVVAPLAGRLTDKVGARPLTVAGMSIVAVTLAALAIARPGQVLLVAGLALVGVGLGLFTPSNNAAIMSSAPRRESGVASGVLNMTRGLGTALGLALTGMVYGLVASPGEGLKAALVFLAVVSFASVMVAGMRRGRRAGAAESRPL
jgi:MFS family permease